MKPAIILGLLLVFILAACSPSAQPTRGANTILAAPPQEGKTVPGEESDLMMATPEAYPTMAPEQPGQGGENPPVTAPLAFSPAGSGLVIKDAQLSLLVVDTGSALDRVTGLAADEGGYIISSQTWYQDGYMHASVRLGIPSLRFEEALNQLRRIGVQVLSENAQGQDVTDQYIDLQSRLTNLEATAARVRDFLADAKTIEDSLRISQQLSELETQIEQIKGQMRYFEGRAAFSTVTVTLTPQYPTPTPTVTPTPTPTPTATPAWNPGETFDDASGVLAKNFQGFIDGAIWVGVVAGPWLLLVLLAALITRGIARKSLQSRR